MVARNQTAIAGTPGMISQGNARGEFDERDKVAMLFGGMDNEDEDELMNAQMPSVADDIQIEEPQLKKSPEKDVEMLFGKDEDDEDEWE
jgi:hypothetical protein